MSRSVVLRGAARRGVGPARASPRIARGARGLRGGCAVRWCGAARLPFVLLDEACGGALHGDGEVEDE